MIRLLVRLGGFFAILGGGDNGFTPVPQDLTAYSSLHLCLKAETQLSNPGLLKIELKNVGGGTHAYRISGINTKWQDFTIPFSDFSSNFQPVEVGEFSIVFERNRHLTNRGKVLVDEVEFRTADYVFPDTLPPPKPTNIRLDGSMLGSMTHLVQDTEHTFTATLDINAERLEAVRLAYRSDCEWIRMGKTFTLSNDISFSFSTNGLPVNIPLEVRMVAENYNGISSASEIYSIQIDDTPTGISAEELFRNSYALFEYLRHETGVYADAARFEGEQFHPASVATTGMGLIMLCIADTMQWIDNAEELVLETLKSMNGLRAGFQPERNTTGLFRHFIDLQTGRQAWDSEFSTIDTGILIAGALFCKKYFPDNDSIALLSNALYLTVDWPSTLANAETGGIYLTADSLGLGSGITLPFNEYMIVAWMAKNYYRDNGIAQTLWNNHYADASSLAKSSFQGVEVLTDAPGHFLSGFVPQFNYYLCNYFTTNPDYLYYLENAMKIDTLWWRSQTDMDCYTWGFGAGASNEWVESGYNADNIGYHPGVLASPHIIGGFIPVYPDGLNDLLKWSNNNWGSYLLPDNAQTPVIWRKSACNPFWKAGDIQGIDFSTLLLGMAAHEEFLGTGFFEYFNDFDFPDSTNVDIKN